MTPPGTVELTPQTSTPGLSSHRSPAGWSCESNTGYRASNVVDPFTKASRLRTRKEWPYDGTPNTILLAGIPAFSHDFTPERAES
jgi:hypothetical protein